MKQMVQLSSSDSSNTNPTILGRGMTPSAAQSISRPPSANSTTHPSSSAALKRTVSLTNPHVIKGASYSHTDLLALQSRSASPAPHHHLTSASSNSRKTDKSSKFNSLLQETEDDWASDMDDSQRATARRQVHSIKSIEHKPTSVEASSYAPLKKTHSFPQYPTGLPAGGVREGYEPLLEDPMAIMQPRFLPKRPDYDNSSSGNQDDSTETDSYREEIMSRHSRIDRFKRILQCTNVDLTALRKLAWNGVPEELRACVWPLLLGYLATHSDRRKATLARKRQEYLDGCTHAWRNGQRGLDQLIWHQIHIDVPRTNPLIRLWQVPTTQRALERILYLWAIRHPASGYVQGINDLATPFFQVFLSAYITTDAESFDTATLPLPVIQAIEADTFWCLTRLLDGIQDNYIHAQPGIVRQVGNLRDLTSRIDAGLVRHLDSEGVEFMQFAFRWINCLLMRELSVKCTTRMWDTYMAEGALGFSDFHLYVCAAFLVKWNKELVGMDFQGILIFLQALPTQTWTDKDVEMLLSEAYLWKSLWSNSPHFTKTTRSTAMPAGR